MEVRRNYNLAIGNDESQAVQAVALIGDQAMLEEIALNTKVIEVVRLHALEFLTDQQRLYTIARNCHSSFPVACSAMIRIEDRTSLEMLIDYSPIWSEPNALLAIKARITELGRR